MIFKARERSFSGRVGEHGRRGDVCGHVKHYGKAISVEEWEATCSYYVENRWKGISDELRLRWERRKGKAIHTLSDFGGELIKWEDRRDADKIVRLRK